MATPRKPKRDLFASAEDDLKQFWAALSGALRAAPRAIAERVGLAAPARKVALHRNAGRQAFSPSGSG